MQSHVSSLLTSPIEMKRSRRHTGRPEDGALSESVKAGARCRARARSEECPDSVKFCAQRVLNLYSATHATGPATAVIPTTAR